MQIPDLLSDKPAVTEPHTASRHTPPAVGQDFAPGSGRRLQLAVGAFTAALVAAFIATHMVRTSQAHRLASSTVEAATKPPAVNTATVHRASTDAALTLPGETAAWYQSAIHARVSGYVANWTANIGDHVKKGQVLATIETPELDASLAAAKAQLNASLAQVNVWVARSDFAKSTYVRWHDSPKGVVSEQEREDKRAGYESAVAELASARAKAKLDQAQVDRLEAFEQFKQVTAPYSGTITSRNIDIGNLVTAGSTDSTTPLYHMDKDDPIRVFVDIPQAEAADLMKNGVPATIKAPGKLDQPIEGKITRTSEAIDPHARTFRAELDIPNPTGSLVPGLYVEVSFQTASNGLLQVPAAALVFRSEGPAVALVTDQGKVTFKPVTIARDDGNVVELSSGVADGDQVVLNVNSQIAEGSTVRIGGTDDRAASIMVPTR
jgi:RND family efflux transporter MFP subunit